MSFKLYQLQFSIFIQSKIVIELLIIIELIYFLNQWSTLWFFPLKSIQELDIFSEVYGLSSKAELWIESDPLLWFFHSKLSQELDMLSVVSVSVEF
jgi:hypothetical protein